VDARRTFKETVDDRVEVDLASYVGHGVCGVWMQRVSKEGRRGAKVFGAVIWME
jgi:hypothetical protein